jgi:hypothetical protein
VLKPAEPLGFSISVRGSGRKFWHESESRTFQRVSGDLVLAYREAMSLTPIERRLLESGLAVRADPARTIDFQHSVLCQTALPYRPTAARVWEREQGSVALSVEAGRIRDVKEGRWVDVPLPHGEKPRLTLIHLNTEALRTGSPVVEVDASMTAFARSIGLDTNGRNLRTLKDQLGRLAAATIRLAVIEDGHAIQVQGHVVGAFDLWFPTDADQRVLWPSTVRLSEQYFASLQKHAVPLDHRAVAALAHSAMGLDVYTWLSQRLHRVAPTKPATITWSALQGQFGVGFARLRDFRRAFAGVLRQVAAVYPEARVDVATVGLVLRQSPPPVLRRLVAVSSTGQAGLLPE